MGAFLKFTIMNLKDSKFASGANEVAVSDIQVTGRAEPAGEGYWIPVLNTKTKAIGELWAHEDHYQALQLDDDNVITNGKLSTKGKGILALGVTTEGTRGGFAPVK